MKAKINFQQFINLKKHIEIAKNNISIPQETNNNWEKYIVKPVIKHRLAPRQARAILEVFGTIANSEINIDNILVEIFDKYIQKEQ